MAEMESNTTSQDSKGRAPNEDETATDDVEKAAHALEIQKFARRYVQVPRWDPCEIGFLLAAKDHPTAFTFFSLDLYHRRHEGANLATEWKDASQVPRRKDRRPLDPANDLEDDWTSKTNDVKEAIKRGELSRDKDGVLRADAIRWLRKYGVEIDETVPEYVAGYEEPARHVEAAHTVVKGKGQNARSKPKENAPIVKLPKPTQWHNIRMKFKNGDAVTVFAHGEKIALFTSAELGFGNSHTGKANVQWELLKGLAEHGEIQALKDQPRIRQRLDETLRIAFGIPDHAITKDKRERVWQPVFVLEPEYRM
jgi:hypothetical protein